MKNKEIIKKVLKGQGESLIYGLNDISGFIRNALALKEAEMRPLIKKSLQSNKEWMQGYNRLEEDAKRLMAQNINLKEQLKQKGSEVLKKIDDWKEDEHFFKGGSLETFDIAVDELKKELGIKQDAKGRKEE